MSNCKEVYITGELPFHVDNNDLAAMIGRISLPSFGLHMEWGHKSRYKANEHGGQTAMYSFELMGMEAVSWKFFEQFVELVETEGGSIVDNEVSDREA